MTISRKMLGLAATERSITAVEVGPAHGRPSVLRAAEFPMPEGDAARDPAALGRALRQFLKQNHFSCSRCVIGLGTRWLVAREKPLPPTAPDLMAGVLSRAAEREFASDSKDLVLDYTKPVDCRHGDSSTGQGQSVLLVAAQRQNVDHLLAAAEAAGLSIAAVTSSTMALASATGGPAASRRLVLYLSPGGADLCVQSAGAIGLLRTLPVAAPAVTLALPPDGWLDGLADELRRLLALRPGAAASAQAPQMVVWNATGLSAGALAALGERLSLETKLCAYPADLGIAEEPPAPAGESAAATALALAGLQPNLLAVDFLHSRLAPRKKLAFGRKIVWAVGLTVAVVIACLALFLAWQRQEQEVEDLAGQLAGMKPTVAAAKDVVDKTAFARGWYDRRPRFLDCLRELTLAFPTESRIWATSLGIGEDMRALLSGKASDERAVLEVLDRLTKSPKFSEVKSLYIREAAGGSSEVSFAISLKFVKAD